jgi:hypothetical protein
MAYNEELMEQFAKMQLLKTGEELVLTCETRAHAVNNRIAIYDWLKNTGLKDLFRLRWDNDRIIRVIRLGRNRIVAKKQGGLTSGAFSSGADAVMKRMLSADDLQDALRIARTARDCEEITPVEMGILLTRYEEVMGDDESRGNWADEMDKIG